jgi:hypothetical protein
MNEENELIDQQMQSFIRFLDLLPKGPELELMILKGHLLIEEKLQDLIDSKVPYPQALKDARLTTYQVICITKSLFSHKTELWLWDFLFKFNKLRNDIAHKIEPQSIRDRMKDLADSIKRTVYPETGLGTDHPFVEFYISLWVVYLILMILKESKDDDNLEELLKKDIFL